MRLAQLAIAASGGFATGYAFDSSKGNRSGEHSNSSHDDSDTVDPARTPRSLSGAPADAVASVETNMYGSPVASMAVTRTAYSAGINFRTKQPDWVAQHLSRDMLAAPKDVNRANSQFREDDSVPVLFR